ncbi:MAG: ABC transporter permease [Chloroflexi bacterium]|nr:ABC transporter permease [Chloroflexota bacterium]
MAEKPTSLISLFRSIKRNRRLTFEMTKREIQKKYRGSVLGLVWALITPLLMLLVYTFVFSVILKSRWGGDANESRADFAILLFAGLIVFNIFSEALNQAPYLVVQNVNYVKKVIFPLEILSWVSLGGIFFHAVVQIGILLIVQLFLKAYIPWTVLFVPFILLPMFLLSLGVSWFVSSLGVFIRDIGQMLSLLTTVLLFTSAVFFPISALPQSAQVVFRFNPIVFLVEESRNVMVYGQVPDWLTLALLTVLTAGIAYAGFWWFQKARNGFADVL